MARSGSQRTDTQGREERGSVLAEAACKELRRTRAEERGQHPARQKLGNALIEMMSGSRGVR